jgi:hypothetical protein
MPVTSRDTQWYVGLAIFSVILLALIIAAVLVDPFTANIP